MKMKEKKKMKSIMIMKNNQLKNKYILIYILVKIVEIKSQINILNLKY